MDKLTDLELLRLVSLVGSTSSWQQSQFDAILNDDVEKNYPYKPLNDWKPMPESVNDRGHLFDKLLDEAKERNLIEWVV